MLSAPQLPRGSHPAVERDAGQPYPWLAVGLLERDEQLGLLIDRFERVPDGGRLVLISGEAGAGKSALVQEFRDRHLAGHRVLFGRCDDLFASRPLGPFADIARDHPGALATALAAGEPSAVFDALLADLASPPHPVILVLEDLQWADEATLDLLRFVTRRLDVLPCLVIATHRNDLSADDPLRRAWGSLVGPLVTRVVLQPLSLRAVETLAKGTGIDAASLHTRTAGNPFFVVEVLANEHLGLPTTVRDTILARTARLSGSARDCLDGAAVLGRHAAIDLVVEVSDCEVTAIDECVRAALVVTEGDQLVFRHDLTRETIEGAMTPLRRRQLHWLALQALRDSDDIVQRAHHALGSGDRDAIIALATRAGDACVALGAHQQAAMLYQGALKHEHALDATERLRITQAYATTCLDIERIDDAIVAGDRARGLLVEGGDETALGDWESWLSEVYWAAGRVDEALSLILNAVERFEPHGASPALARAVGQLAAQRMLSGRFDQAIFEGRRALDLAERFELEAVAVRALDVVGMSMSVTGDADGIVLQHEALDRAKRAGLAAASCLVCVNLGGAYLSTAGPARAAEFFTEGLVIAEEHDLVYRRNCLIAFRLDSLLLLGRWDDAVADSRALLGEPNLAAHHRGMALCTIGRIHARRGEDAGTALDLALEIMEAVGEPQFIHPVRMARAEDAWLGDDDARARAEVEAALLLVDRLDALNLRDLERWARRTQVDWRADAHDAASEQLRAGARSAAAFWEHLGCPYEAADALADSDDEADLRDALARLLDLAARPRAQQVARRLRALGVKDVPRGPRAATRANAAGLTGRELEVAALLGAGLRNADIANRLVLSPKTVDHHVSAVLSKLGIGNRRQVAKAASDLGIELAGPRPGPAGS